jgi:hypothetical protein
VAFDLRSSWLSNWQVWFPGCEPIAHHLRTAFPQRWVRFHSLPGSQRYPGSEAEYATVLSRHNCILGELAEPGQKVVLLTTGFSESPEPVRQHELQALDSDGVPWRSLAMHDLEADYTRPSYWHVYASEWEWRPGRFDRLIRLVADDVVSNVAIVGTSYPWLLHPYDGGMDVIAESTAARDRLKTAHADWLSTLASGL